MTPPLTPYYFPPYPLLLPSLLLTTSLLTTYNIDLSQEYDKKHEKGRYKYCKKEKTDYLCIVFFMVLDLRLTKGWDSAESLFLCPFLSTLPSTLM